MGLFKNIFKKKEGGTLVGNLVRKVANSASSGVLGNGLAMIGPDRDQQDVHNDVVQGLAVGLGSGLVNGVYAAQNNGGLAPEKFVTNVQDAATKSVIKNAWDNYKPKIVKYGLIIVGVIVAWKMFGHQISGKRRY